MNAITICEFYSVSLHQITNDLLRHMINIHEVECIEIDVRGCIDLDFRINTSRRGGSDDGRRVVAARVPALIPGRVPGSGGQANLTSMKPEIEDPGGGRYRGLAGPVSGSGVVRQQ